MFKFLFFLVLGREKNLMCGERVWCKHEVSMGLEEKEDIPELFTMDGYSFFLVLRSPSHRPFHRSATPFLAGFQNFVHINEHGCDLYA